ncbi:MAG: hypothetical protein KJZ69_18630 [Phycisphaerales bacterium]|nr:hypothetical protein [Phycisphaerales bacterium]
MTRNVARITALAVAFSLSIAPITAARLLQSERESILAAIDDQLLAADAGLVAMLGEFVAPTDPASLVAPDFPAISHDPARHRGELFRFSTSPATRVTSRAFGIDGLSAWQFASPDIDEPILLLIHEPQGTAAPGDHVGNITIAAFFHKTAIARMRRSGPGGAIGLEDMDAAGEQRVLVFVGANPIYSPAAPQSWRGWSGAVLAVGMAIVLLWLTRLMVVKRRGLAEPQTAALLEPERWNDTNLPPEPAEALAELRRRASDTMTHER